MKALQTVKPLDLQMIEIPKPEIKNSTDVLVKITAAGICGSDVHIYHGTSPVATYPRIMGHEAVGIVEQIGADVKGLQVGEHVVINQIITCGDCYPCNQNRPNICFSLQVRGVHTDGGYTEYCVIGEKDLYKIPKSIPFADAVMIEPMSIAYQALSRGEVGDDDILFVLGAGALGKSIINVAKSLTKATVIVADVADARLEEAKALGADYVINSTKENLNEAVKKYSGGYGATVSIDAAGILQSLEILTDVTCNAGIVVAMAFLSENSNVQQFKITAKELDVRGSRLQNKMFPKVIKDLEDGRLSVDGMVSHKIPFENAIDAFKMIDAGNDPSIKKVVLTFD